MPNPVTALSKPYSYKASLGRRRVSNGHYLAPGVTFNGLRRYCYSKVTPALLLHIICGSSCYYCLPTNNGWQYRSSYGNTSSYTSSFAFSPRSRKSGIVSKSQTKQIRGESVYASLETEQYAASEKWWMENDHLWTFVQSIEEYDEVISSAPPNQLIVCDFFASWCKACKALYPKLNQIAKEMNGKVTFMKVASDLTRDVTVREKIRALPYIRFYRNGKPLVQFHTHAGKAGILKLFIEKALNSPNAKRFEVLGNQLLEKEDNGDDESKVEEKKSTDLKTMRSSMDELRSKLKKEMSQYQTPPAVQRPSITPHNELRLREDTNETLEDEGKMEFLEKYKDVYGYNSMIDKIYQREIGCRLGENGHYMDYMGSSLYCNSQLQNVFNEFSHNVYGNPHSMSPSSEMTERMVEEARIRVLKFFNASPADYQVIFCKSATDALKIVGETFPWSPQSQFVYLREVHNSVLGIRQYASSHYAAFRSIEEEDVDAFIESEKTGLSGSNYLNNDETAYSLFTMPAEENFAGVKYNLDWLNEFASGKCNKRNSKWKTLLDAAGFVGTNPLDLKKYPADFVTVSFYKIFGYPTGLGALIVRTEDLDILQKVFWGGGSVSLASSDVDFHVFKNRPTSKFEDGTVAFLDIISLRHGFNMIDRLGGMKAVQKHVHALTEYFYDELTKLHHKNGRPVVVVYGKHHYPDSAKVQGAVLNFSVLDPDGYLISYLKVQKEAAKRGFHIRSGAECNPGAVFHYLGVTTADYLKIADETEGCKDDVEWVGGLFVDGSMVAGTAKALGSVRASLGYMSRYEDVRAFVDFIRDQYSL